MPAEGVPVAPRDELLTFEEITRVVRVAVSLGIDEVRLSGGEPLVRRELPKLVASLSRITKPGGSPIGLALTTNGIQLAEHAEALRDAGLHRVNISLDALDPQVFHKITRRDQFSRVLDGIAAARRVGFDPVKINAVALRGITESQIVAFGRMARETGLQVRFIEYMPLDASNAWERERVLFAEDIRYMLEAAFLPLRDVAKSAPGTASVYEFADGIGQVGFVPTVSEPFCGSCNRFRLTADGKLRGCLFSLDESDLRKPLRSGAPDEVIVDCIRETISSKWAGHGINSDNFVQPLRPMSAIGG